MNLELWYLFSFSTDSGQFSGADSKSGGISSEYLEHFLLFAFSLQSCHYCRKSLATRLYTINLQLFVVLFTLEHMLDDV